MRKLVIASHERMAYGVKCTLDFITNGSYEIYEISAYMDESKLEDKISSLFKSFLKDDEIIILTDMLSGSVNQAFIPYRNDHTFLITGYNLPLALELLLYPENEKLDYTKINELINKSKSQIQIVTNCDDLVDDE